jgi:hypothetical protein
MGVFEQLGRAFRLKIRDFGHRIASTAGASAKVWSENLTIQSNMSPLFYRSGIMALVGSGQMALRNTGKPCVGATS